MKTFFASLIFVLFVSPSFSQDPTDALRYSFLTNEGNTARIQALGGAGASLGGEFSSLFINPAGLGFFKTGDFVFTPSLLINSNESEYMGTSANASGEKLGIGASGILFASQHPGKKIKTVTIGIGINKTANFNNDIYYSGINRSSSYSEKFVEEFRRDQVFDNDAANFDYPFGSSLALRTYLINPVVDGSGRITDYTTLANPAMGLSQRMDKKTSGGITDLAFGVGANVQDRFFFGGTLGVPVLKYHRDALYSEDDASKDPNNYFNYFDAHEILETKGVGINLKLGAIYKPSVNFQAGFAFYTPTFFQLTDLYNMTITTDPEGYEGQGVLTLSSTDLNDDRYLRSTYNLVTPLRAMLGGTYFITTGGTMGQPKGFVTADVEFVDYRASNFLDANNSESYKSYYRDLNSVIDDTYKPAINVRLGGELKLNSFMVRLGGAYYGNPYEHETSDLAKLTGGLGYRIGGFYADLAYTYAINNTIDRPYQLERTGVPAASLSNRGSNIALTVGFKLY